jgi:hypothetical protein
MRSENYEKIVEILNEEQMYLSERHHYDYNDKENADRQRKEVREIYKSLRAYMRNDRYDDEMEAVAKVEKRREKEIEYMNSLPSFESWCETNG